MLLGFIPLQYYYRLLGFIPLQYYCRQLLFSPLQYYTITRGSRPDILSLVLSSSTIFSLELSLSPILRHLPWLYPAPILLYAPGDCPSPVLLYSPCILSLSLSLSLSCSLSRSLSFYSSVLFRVLYFSIARSQAGRHIIYYNVTRPENIISTYGSGTYSTVS